MPIAAGLHYFLHEGGKPTSPPLVLIHGAGGDHLSWPAEIRNLSNRRVFALDLPGHGKSTGSGCQTVDDYSGRVIDFLDAIRVSRAVIVGHAMGGAIALTLALDHADRVRGIGLISCGAQLPIAASILENASNPATVQLSIRALLELMHLSREAFDFKERAFKKLTNIRQSLLYGDLCACAQFDASERLSSIETSTLVVCGTEDKLTPQHFSSNLAGGINGAALQTIDNAGHLVMLEKPHRVAGLLGVFLKTIPFIPGT